MTQLQRALLLSLLLACGKDGGDKTATVETFGKKPVPLGDLTKVKAGMTQAQVKALFPDAKPPANHSGSPVLAVASPYSNLEYRIDFYGDKDEVASVRIRAPKELAAKLEASWGTPAKTFMGLEWVNAEDGYDVAVMEMGRRSDIRFSPFVTLTPEFFGTAPGPVDALKKLKPGMTREEVKAAAPGLEGAPKGGGSYVPYKAGPKDVTLSVEFHYETDKLESMHIAMPGTGIAAMEKAWGPGKKGKTRGTGSPMECWETADKTMRVEARIPDAPSEKTSVDIVPPERSLCVTE